MIELYKFINKDTIIRAKNPLWVGDTVISNPTEETLRSLGYTDMISGITIPKTKESEAIIPQYAINEKGIIVQTFKVRDVQDEFI